MAGSQGSLSLTYTVDGGSRFQRTLTFPGGARDWIHLRLIETGAIAPGNHTVKVVLDRSIGQSLMIDYMLYTPTFATLATMPDLSALVSPPPSPTPSVTSLPLPTESRQSEPSSSSSSSGTPAGAIAGGVVGGLVAAALLVLLFFLWRRRRREADTEAQARPISGSRLFLIPISSPSNTPSAFRSPLSGYQIEPLHAGPTSGMSERSTVYSPQPTLPSTVPRQSSDQLSSITSGSQPQSQSQSVANRRAEINRRIQELQVLITQYDAEEAALGPSSSAAGPGVEQSTIDEMRRQIQQLSEENARLAGIPPPAYQDGALSPSRTFGYSKGS